MYSGGTISHLGDIPLLFMSAYTAVVTALNM